MIRIQTPEVPELQSGTKSQNPFVLDFHRARHTLLMHLAAINGLYCQDTRGSSSGYSYYTTGSLIIHIPMETQKEQFKMNSFLWAAIELNLLQALEIHCDTNYERDWVGDFLEQNHTTKQPGLLISGEPPPQQEPL